jgi:hypothetical protein
MKLARSFTSLIQLVAVLFLLSSLAGAPAALGSGLKIALPAQSAAQSSGQAPSAGVKKRAAGRRLSRVKPYKGVTLGHSTRRLNAHLSPSAFVDQRVQKILTDLSSRPVHPATVLTAESVTTIASKNQFLSSLYDRNLVDANWSTEMLSDKLLMARMIERELGTRSRAFLPKTLGLREFLAQHNLVQANGELVHDGDKIETALAEEFPAGFVVRPAVGIAPTETGRGMFRDGDQFIVELLKPDSFLYNAKHLRRPVISHILNDVASGEAVVLQENIVAAADAHKPLKNRFYQEVRVHTFEGRVVEGAVPERWVQVNLLTKAQTKAAEDFVAEFLKNLPVAIMNRQAWGVDVAVVDNGEMRIVDIVTNLPWSGYLDQPRVLGAYARHLESYYGIKFSGVSGSLLRHNFGNYLPYWSKRIEKARPGVERMLAYLPPIP